VTSLLQFSSLFNKLLILKLISFFVRLQAKGKQPGAAAASADKGSNGFAGPWLAVPFRFSARE